MKLCNNIVYYSVDAARWIADMGVVMPVDSLIVLWNVDAVRGGSSEIVLRRDCLRSSCSQKSIST